MENMKKWLSLLAASMILFNNPISAVELTAGGEVSSKASIDIGKNNMILGDDGNTVVIGTIVESDGVKKVENVDKLTEIFKFNSKEIKIKKSWDGDNLKYNYQIADGNNSSKINFAIQNRSAKDQNVKLEFTIDSSIDLKTSFLSDFLKIKIIDDKGEHIEPVSGTSSYSTNVSIEGKGKIKQIEIEIDLNALDLDKVLGQFNPDSGEEYVHISLFDLKLTLDANSFS